MTPWADFVASVLEGLEPKSTGRQHLISRWSPFGGPWRCYMFAPATKTPRHLMFLVYGAAGGGKTVSTIRTAQGVCDDPSKVFVVDTNAGQASEIAGDDFGDGPTNFTVATLPPPYTVDALERVIAAAKAGGCEVLIIDNLSDWWSGEGGVHSLHGADEINPSIKLNGFQLWAKWGPVWDRILRILVESPFHIIVTATARTLYEPGTSRPTKIGSGPQLRPESELVFQFIARAEDAGEAVTIEKTRTPAIPLGEVLNRPGADFGRRLAEWAAMGDESVRPQLLEQLDAWVAKVVGEGADEQQISTWIGTVVDRDADAAVIAERLNWLRSPAALRAFKNFKG